jgi:hypothetical protein
VSAAQRFPVGKVARAIQKVRRGWAITDALTAVGIPRPTWYVWLSPATYYPDGDYRSPEALAFAARVRHAFERATAQCAGRAQQTVLQAAKSSVGTLDWRAAHEHLKHAEATRARWHEYRELRVMQTGSVDHRHRLVEQASDQELLAAVPAEWRELVEPGEGASRLHLPALSTDGSADHSGDHS